MNSTHSTFGGIYPYHDLSGLNSTARANWEAIWITVSISWWWIVFLDSIFTVFSFSSALPHRAVLDPIYRCDDSCWLVKRRCCDRGLRTVVSLQCVSFLSAVGMSLALFTSPATRQTDPVCEIEAWFIEQSFLWKFALLMGFDFLVLVDRIRTFSCGRKIEPSILDEKTDPTTFHSPTSPLFQGRSSLNSNEIRFNDGGTAVEVESSHSLLSRSYSFEDEISRPSPAESTYDLETGCKFELACCLFASLELFIHGLAFVFGTSLTVALVERLYGRIEYWCWIADPLHKADEDLMQALFLYIPTWTCWGIMGLLYCILFLVMMFHGGCCTRDHGDTDEDRDCCKECCFRFKRECSAELTGCTFVTCSPLAVWFWPSLNRIFSWNHLGGTGHFFVIQLLTLDFTPTFGIVNFIFTFVVSTFVSLLQNGLVVLQSEAERETKCAGCLLLFTSSKKPNSKIQHAKGCETNLI